MWAQLITFNVKSGKEAGVAPFFNHLQAIEQPDSGLIRQTLMHDHSDPRRVYVLVVFESEAKARERENDPRRAEGQAEVRDMMAEILDGPPTFVDLTVTAEAHH